MGGNQVPPASTDNWDAEGYDEAQRAEIIEATQDGPSNGTILTDIPLDDPEALSDEDDLEALDDELGEEDPDAIADPDDVREDEIQADLDDDDVDEDELDEETDDTDDAFLEP
jgi:DNA-directed RNA polymerase subunit delta